jgi:hypothetical protein
MKPCKGKNLKISQQRENKTAEKTWKVNVEKRRCGDGKKLL